MSEEMIVRLLSTSNVIDFDIITTRFACFDRRLALLSKSLGRNICRRVNQIRQVQAQLRGPKRKWLRVYEGSLLVGWARLAAGAKDANMYADLSAFDCSIGKSKTYQLFNGLRSVRGAARASASLVKTRKRNIGAAAIIIVANE